MPNVLVVLACANLFYLCDLFVCVILGEEILLFTSSPSTSNLSLRFLTRRMASTASTASTISKLPNIPQADIDSFHAHISSSTKILALLGAGLSASSGLPTFRGAGGLWRTHEAMDLATPEAFEDNPGLVWQFYNYRRHMALKARPNPAHFALAELARKRDGFQTLSQNVDGMLMG